MLSTESTTIATWMLALILVGIGWNLGFSSATVLLTHVYADAPSLKSKVQAANDFVMFLLAGSFIFSTGYIYEAGGSSLPGWRTVNVVVLGMIGIMALIVVGEMTLQQRESKQQKKYSAGEPDQELGPSDKNLH